MCNGGEEAFLGFEDYRSPRRFCVLEARGALLGLVGSALDGLARFPKLETTASLHLGKVWAWGTCVGRSLPPPPLFVMVGGKVLLSALPG